MCDEIVVRLSVERDDKVELAGLQLCGQDVVLADDRLERHLRGIRQETAASRGQQEARGGRHDAHADEARHPARHLVDFPRRLVGGDAQAPRAREQQRAGRREPDSPPDALEQRRAERRLEPAHAARERGLRAVQRFAARPRCPSSAMISK